MNKYEAYFDPGSIDMGHDYQSFKEWGQPAKQVS